MTGLRNEAAIGEVRAAVLELALASTEPVYANPSFLVKVATLLSVDTAASDRIGRRYWHRFTGQVKRSLDGLAITGALVKGTGAYGTLYRTPVQQEAYTAESGRLAAVRARHRAERERVYDELLLHGIDIESERGQVIRLSQHAWLRIIAALDAAVAERNTR